MAEQNSANIGFEKQIWDAACVLRGNLDASEYKQSLLGLIFLKYISDRFDARYHDLKEEGEGFEEDIDEYTSQNIFFVPADARWEIIARAAHSEEVGTTIDNAMRLHRKGKPQAQGHSAEKFCATGAGQAALRQRGRSLHQHPNDGSRRGKGHSRSRI